MTILTLTLLGSFQILVNGEPIFGVDSNKVRALLVYLAVEADRSHRRDVLAEMFWPDKPEGVARRSLKQALSNLRKSVGDREAKSPFLLVSREAVQFNSVSDCRIDVTEFSALIKDSKSHEHHHIADCRSCARRLQQAVALYRGDFLEQFSLPDSIEFAEWVAVNREALQRQLSEALRNLIKHCTQNGNNSEACDHGYQLVAFEPWNEENHRELMRLLALCGQRSAALMQYQVCCRILTDELGVEPAQETVDLYEQIRDGAYAQPVRLLHKKHVEISILKSRPFKLPTLVPLFILYLVLGIGLVVGFLKLNSGHQAAADSENPGASESVVVNDTNTLATSIPATGARVVVQSTTDETGIPQMEYQALITLYNETGGANWRDSRGWLSDASPCSWFGVTCSGGLIVALTLTDNNLNGQIPQEISLLANLKFINLEFNQLHDNIPPELGDLSNLESLSLSGNSQLGGPIPPELGDLTNLQTLVLSSYEGGTQLSGPIPPELGNLRRLTWLELANSLVSGPIPPELGNLTYLRFLDLSNNPLSGSLPAEMGNLVNLTHLAVGEGQNKLEGPLPLSLMNLKKLRLLLFYETELCEPPDAAFQEWLNGIDELLRTGVLC